jgi:hypothetical protein
MAKKKKEVFHVLMFQKVTCKKNSDGQMEVVYESVPYGFKIGDIVAKMVIKKYQQLHG